MATKADILLDELTDKVDEINSLVEKLYKAGVNIGFKQKPLIKDGFIINTIEYVHWFNYSLEEDTNV